MKKNNLKIFTDFDGTITKKDIGDELFKDFGKFEPYHSQLVAGDLNIEDYWKCLFKELNSGIGKEEIKEYAEKCEVDNYFPVFAEFCRTNDIDLAVVSDGFDAYIEPILAKMNLDHLPVYCNKMIFNINEKPIPFYTNASESCECLCASCKRNSILTQCAENDIIVYIGDGYSDYCSAEHSDIIFAKKHLAAYCNKERLPHYPFKTFFDVKRIIEKLLVQGNFRRRHQAHIKRLKAFEWE